LPIQTKKFSAVFLTCICSPQFERDSATHVFTLDFHFSLRYCGDNRSLVPQKKIIMIRQLVNFATANFTR